MGRYAKSVEGVDHYYQPEDLFEYVGEEFDVRVTLPDDPLEGGLWVTVPADQLGRPIDQILDEHVIGADPEQTEIIRDGSLELEDYPHLSDALDRVADVWHRYRRDEGAGLRLCINNGPDDVAFEDSAREHMGTCVWKNGEYDYMLLDLVLEPSEATLAGMLGERKREHLLWMQGLLAFYKLDTDPSAERPLRKRPDLAAVREQLFFHNLVAPGSRGKLEITQQGRRAIGRLNEEQDELIARYDVYRDVVTRREADGSVRFEFATLSGVDYRVAVYRHVGVDPFRAVFVLTLLAGELDEDVAGKKWLEAMANEALFESVLKPAVDYSVPAHGSVEELVRQGTQYLARTAAQRGRARYSEQVLARTGTIEAFPREGAGAGAPLRLPPREPPGARGQEAPGPATPAGPLPTPSGPRPGAAAGPPLGAGRTVAVGPGAAVIVSRGRAAGGPFGRRRFGKARDRSSTLPPPSANVPAPGAAVGIVPPGFPPPPGPTEPPREREEPSPPARVVRSEDEAMEELDSFLAQGRARDEDVAEAERELDEELARSQGGRPEGSASRPAATTAPGRAGPDPEPGDDGWL